MPVALRRTGFLPLCLVRLRRIGGAMPLLVALAGPVEAQRMLVPMDDAQQNHLKAYGLTFTALKDGLPAEWLLNYRGGAFLLADAPELRRRAAIEGVTVEPLDQSAVAAIRNEMASANMDAVILEKAPRIAVFRDEGIRPTR